MNVIEQLKKKEGFTSAESSLANYIVNNLDEVYRMSLQDLAKASYVSKPSVIRLYRKIGCRSYRDFSIALQLEQITKGKNIEIDSTNAFIEKQSLGEFAEMVGQLSKQIIDNCIAAIKKDELEDIIRVLNDATRIFVYADGEIITEVRSFNNRMSKMGVEPIMINDVDDPQKMIASIREDDAVIIISSLAENDSFNKMIEFIYETDALKILVTTFEDPNKRFQSISQMSLLLGMNIIQACLWKLRFEKN